jgi:hypothetical protein
MSHLWDMDTVSHMPIDNHKDYIADKADPSFL